MNSLLDGYIFDRTPFVHEWLAITVHTVQESDNGIVQLKSMPDLRIRLKVKAVNPLLSAIRSKLPSGPLFPRSQEALDTHRHVIDVFDELTLKSLQRDGATPTHPKPTSRKKTLGVPPSKDMRTNINSTIALRSP